MIVLAFPGLGKTTVASKYKNIIDLESSDYMWTLSKLFEDVPVELRKGIYRGKKKENWEVTYVDEAVKYDQIGYHVCMAWYPEVQEELCRRDLNFVSIMPSYEFFFRELINRYHERGNNDTFIEKVILIYKENHKDGFSKYKNLQFICKGNLEDWLLENGVNLNLRYGTPEPIKMDLFDSECSKEIESFLSKLNDLDKKRNFVGNELLSYTDYNVDKVRDYIKKDPVRIEQAYKLYYDGVDWEDIAKVTGLGRHLCQAILTYFKELRECEEVSKMDLFDDKVIEENKHNDTQEHTEVSDDQILDDMGITVKDVRDYIKENPKDAKKAWYMIEEEYYPGEISETLDIEYFMCCALKEYFKSVGDIDIKDVVLPEDGLEENKHNGTQEHTDLSDDYILDGTEITVKDVRNYIKENPKDAKEAWCLFEECYHPDEVARDLGIDSDLSLALKEYFHLVGDVDIKGVILVKYL